MTDNKKIERRKKLLTYISSDPGILMRDLAVKLDVSRETIRRDFDALCEQGLAQRRYGGAAFPPTGNLLSFSARQDKHLTERKAIVRKAHLLMEEGHVIMLGPGTTALLFAEELRQTGKSLTVITNGVREALALAENENVRVILAPGEIDGSEGFVSGHETTAFLSKFKANIAVFCADGLAKSGVTEADSRTVWTVRTMIQQSTQRMLLIDHFRFDEQGFEQICDLADLTCVISDRKPEPELLKELERNQVVFHRS
jgi:DeoR/GlpR family transcriptional regulator of sugar metabolism